jgi:hypothetical protein
MRQADPSRGWQEIVTQHIGTLSTPASGRPKISANA